MLVWSLTFYLKDPFHGLFSFQMFNFILQSANIFRCSEYILHKYMKRNEPDVRFRRIRYLRKPRGMNVIITDFNRLGINAEYPALDCALRPLILSSCPGRILRHGCLLGECGVFAWQWTEALEIAAVIACYYVLLERICSFPKGKTKWWNYHEESHCSH